MTISILVIFPDEWISYSPSIINLLNYMADKCGADVHLICFDSGRYPIELGSLHRVKVNVIKVNRYVLWFAGFLGLYRWYKKKKIYSVATAIEKCIVIGVDELGVESGLAFANKIHFFSLEIESPERMRKYNDSTLASVAIQSVERYRYLFGGQDRRLFIIPNSPNFVNDVNHGSSWPAEKKMIVCFGNLIPKHGVYQCVECLETDSDIVLTLAGRVPDYVKKRLMRTYAGYVNENRLIFYDQYIEQGKVVDFLSRYHVGLCFYDFALIRKGDFNYLSSPSGKIYNYFAAGLPVIGSNIIGLKVVETYNAGVLLDKVTGVSIGRAIKQVFKRYSEYRSSAISAANAFDFDKAMKPYADYLLESSSLVVSSQDK